MTHNELDHRIRTSVWLTLCRKVRYPLDVIYKGEVDHKVWYQTGDKVEMPVWNQI
ncbi:hypothetical protein LCGC14_2424510, partial [marine sediment metagenome]